MLGHTLEETSQHSGDQHSELGTSINPNSCLLGVGGGQSPPPTWSSHRSSFPPSLSPTPPGNLPSAANPRGGPQAMSMLKAEPQHP